MDINIKNMVCNRCIMVVSQIFEKAGIKTENIQLGKVKTTDEVAPEKLEQLNESLKHGVRNHQRFKGQVD